MRKPVAALLLAGALLSPSLPVANAETAPPTLSAYTQIRTNGSYLAARKDPTTAADLADGGLRVGDRTMVPPTGMAFSGLTTFDLGSAVDATHGTLNGANLCAAPTGTVTVREATTTSTALDYTATCPGYVDGGSLRRASTVPYGYAVATNNGQRTIPYTGGTVTVTVRNTGSADLVPGAAVVTPTHASANVLVDGCDEVMVAPAGSCTVTVSVTPDPATPQGSFVLRSPVPALPVGSVTSAAAFTGGTAPTSPRNLAVTATALGSVQLTWDAPTDTGGNPVTYNVVRDGARSGVGSTSGLALVDRKAGLGTFHRYVVQARTVAGSSADSTDVQVTTAQEGLVVDRPDGTVYAEDTAHRGTWLPTSLLPGGTVVRDGWVANLNGKLVAQSIGDGSYDSSGVSPSAAGHDYSPTSSSLLLYARAGKDGIDDVHNGYLRPDLADDLLITHAAQPTSGRGLSYAIAVPVGKRGPTGGNLVSLNYGDGIQVAGTAGALHPALSSDVRWLAYVQPDGHGKERLRLRTLDGPLKLVTSGLDLTSVTSIRWTPDNRQLLVFDQTAKALYGVVVDPRDGPGAVTMLAAGDQAGPGQFATLSTFDTEDLGDNGLTWRSVSGATYACFVDGVAQSTCASPLHPRVVNGTHTWSVTQSVPGLRPRSSGVSFRKIRTCRDFDNDGKADFVVFRPSNGTWHVRGKPIVSFGRAGDVPLVADVTGDGAADIAVYRPSTSTFYVKGRPAVIYGRRGDVPVPGDYNGDGKDDLAVYRPSTGYWYVQGGRAIKYGEPGYLPVPGYWAHDARVVPGICDPRSGSFVAFHGNVDSCAFGDIGDTTSVELSPGISQVVSRQGATFYGAFVGTFAAASDVPVLGNYGGDEAPELTVWRPSTGQWVTRGHSIVVWGQRGDVPL